MSPFVTCESFRALMLRDKEDEIPGEQALLGHKKRRLSAVCCAHATVGRVVSFSNLRFVSPYSSV
jgi:hypothetical protein